MPFFFKPGAKKMKDEGDEAIISMSVAGEVTDTSIIEVGRSRPQYQYTREQLLAMQDLPASRCKPKDLDSAYNNSHGVWDPERWSMDKKRIESSPDHEKTGRGGSGDQVPENHNKRRSGDPRERIRKEQDGIILSPQRRSFNSGCFVNVTQPTSRRPESPINKTEVSHREPPGRNRIGSGRIINCDMWGDYRSDMDKMDLDRPDYNYRSSIGGQREGRDNRDNIRDRDRERDRDRDTGHERERRTMRNYYEKPSESKKYQSNNNDRRRTYSEKENDQEPEWFISGPTSQNDTIELKGFEDEERGNNNTKGKKQSPSRRRKRNLLRNITAEKETDKATTDNNSSGSKGRSTPTSSDSTANAMPHSPISEKNEKEEEQQKIVHESTLQKEKSQEQNKKEKTNSEATSNVATESTSGDTADLTTTKNRESEPPDFNLDDFLKSDTFPGVHGLLSNGVGTNNGSGSRFSQWFKRESPVQLENNKGSIQDELLNNLLNDITEPNIQIPSVTESNAYFAPISPANSSNHNSASSTGGVKLLEMLQRGNKPQQNGQGETANNAVSVMKNNNVKEIASGKVMHNLEELEARMRGGVPPSANETQKQNKTEEDLSAFKKLLAQVNGGQAVPAANGSGLQKQQPYTLMQLLNLHMKNQQPQAPAQQSEPVHATNFNHIGPLGPVQHPHQSQMQHENLMKVLHIQQQQQQQQQQKQRQQQQSEMLSMMVGGQRMMGMSPPIPPDAQMLLNNVPPTQNLLQRPEAQAIIHGLQQGEFTMQHIIQQLQNPAMQIRHREVLMNILKVYGGATSRTISPHPGVPNQQDHHLYQQMLYQQQRIPSPMNNVPSQRDIATRTQSIVHSALIKKKLEEQRENYRKRQEQQQQQAHQRISSPVSAASKQTLSPPPLTFTPTSVLRKMTADKEPEGSNDPSKMVNPNQASHMHMQSNVQIMSQSQGVISRHAAMRPQQQQPPPSQQSQHQTSQTSWQNATVKQHSGRPIMKGSSSSQFNQYSNNMAMDYGAQVQRMGCGPYGNPQRSKHTMAGASVQTHSNVPQYNISPNTVMQQRPNQMNSQIKSQVPHNLASIQQQMQQQQQQRTTKQPPIGINQNYNSSRTEQMFADGRAIRPQQLSIGVGRQASPGLGFMGNNGGDLSPTSNQLARWFSPELLAQARAGKLPELGQTNMISLEELERLQHASTVHD